MAIDLDDAFALQRADDRGLLLGPAYAGAVLRRGYQAAIESGVPVLPAGSMRSLVVVASPRLVGVGAAVASLLALVAPAPVVTTTELSAATQSWLSAADAVLILSDSGRDEFSTTALATAQRRGCPTTVLTAAGSALAHSAAAARTPMLRWPGPDPSDALWTAAAVALRVCALDKERLEQVIADVEAAVIAHGPTVGTAANPAKQAGAMLADPGTVLVLADAVAAAVADQVAAAVLTHSGTCAGRADLRVSQAGVDRLVERADPGSDDIFHDPFLDPPAPQPRMRLRLVLLVHASDDELQRRMIEFAAQRGVALVVLEAAGVDPLGRAAALMVIGALSAGYAALVTSAG